MDNNMKLRFFLAQLRKFLPEKTIYEALSSLPEDIFDVDDYLHIPCLSSDEDVKKFICDNGFEDPENIIRFFMDQYMVYFDEIINDIFEELDISDGSNTINSSYNCLRAE